MFIFVLLKFNINMHNPIHFPVLFNPFSIFAICFPKENPKHSFWKLQWFSVYPSVVFCYSCQQSAYIWLKDYAICYICQYSNRLGTQYPDVVQCHGNPAMLNLQDKPNHMFHTFIVGEHCEIVLFKDLYLGLGGI